MIVQNSQVNGISPPQMIRKVPAATANNLALGSSSAPSTSTVNKGDGNPKLGSAKNVRYLVHSQPQIIETNGL